MKAQRGGAGVLAIDPVTERTERVVGPSDGDAELGLEQDGPEEDEGEPDPHELEGGGSEPLEAVASVEAEASPSGATELEVGAGNQLGDEELFQSVAALVYASPEPLSERRLALLLEGPEIARVRAALETLRERVTGSGLPYELREIAGGWQILTVPALGVTVQKLFKARKAERISSAALETLAVVAYRQPVTKAEIEAIRGVQAGPILRSLIDKGLVRVAGRADVPGHPLQYATTRAFLDRFGLARIEDLPRDSELARD